jgi:nitrate reductase alpha subunit
VSHLLDRLLFFKKNVGTFSGGHGVVTREDRTWEDGYRNRWDHDKVVRSTHGVNCTGSCSWNVFVKGGIVTWEMQATDYPRTRPDLPNHEPRGCARGASASWYLYSGNRVKRPLVRKKLLELWRSARASLDPVEAWHRIVSDPEQAASYKRIRGRGGFVRASWSEVEEIVAAATVDTVREHGPDRVAGFTPIPAFSMASFASGTRFLSLLGGTCLSFYDWYADLPPSSPMTWGEQTDVPESAAWYDAGFLILWGSNVPQTRTPDAHFLSEVRYKGTKTVVVSPDYNEAAKFADLWVRPKARTDAALALAMGHVILNEFHVRREVPAFRDYVRRFSDLPLLVRLRRRGDGFVPERLVRASDFEGSLGETNHAEWKTVGLDEDRGDPVVPTGSIGFRWGNPGKWSLGEHDARDDRPVRLALTLASADAEIVAVAFPDFGGASTGHGSAGERVRNVAVRRLRLGGEDVPVATVYDLLVAHYGVDRGLGGDVARSYDDADAPYTPAWQERITGVDRAVVIRMAREFAETAEKTGGRSKVVIGCGVNQAYHTDMTYRAVITMLVLCGCVGVPGGGWAHYVGQEKIRPMVGWSTLAFALDWSRPPRQMNSTSYFYAHTDQFRYETLSPAELLSPTEDVPADAGALLDWNVRAERMGWLPTSPQLSENPLHVAAAARAAGRDPAGHVVSSLVDGSLRLACEDPDDPRSFPRILFVWRANLLGASGKGHEYFLKHLLGAKNGVAADDLGVSGGTRPHEVVWRENAPEGKLDLLVTLDFRMSSTGIYSDIVLPSATWYEKNDLSTTDLHPFVHPFGAAVDPLFEARSDWEIFKALARGVSTLSHGRLGVEQDVVLVPIQHDGPGELAVPFEVRDWKRGECEPVPGKTMPQIVVVERDYPNLHRRFTSLGPLVAKAGIGAKGISWSAAPEVDLLGELNGRVEEDGPCRGLPRLETDIHACEAILALSPETNGEVAVRAFDALSAQTGRAHRHLAMRRSEEKIRFHDLVAQPRKVISSPIWSGIDSEEVSYTAFWQNVNELVPWRTLSGRQQLFQDHPWMRAFGECFALYRPPLDTRSCADVGEAGEGLVLSFLTPHQKWSIHSSYTENLLMLSLARGGPVVWLNESEAASVGISDNDWIEASNRNGAVVARAIVSQRVQAGTCMMYHAQEKLVATPEAPTTGTRGIHNSVTRIVPKPTHMIGGYAHQSYGWNYYGTIGTNRDETVRIRRIDRVQWREEETPS